MVSWVANIISSIGTCIWDNVALHRILTGIKSCWRACAEDKIGGKFPFLIELILTDYVEIVFSIKAIGVPIAIVDSSHLSFGSSQRITYPAGEFAIVFLYINFHAVGATDTTE